MQGRIWYRDPGQWNPAYGGSHSQPSRTGRVLDDGASQIVQATYNALESILTPHRSLGASRVSRMRAIVATY